MHQLDITYHNTFNCKTLRLEDNSIYDELSQIDNVILEIKAPGQNCFQFFTLGKDWKSIVLNCSLLKICIATDPCDYTIIPDGIYDIKYSVDPNEKTLIEFSHMRICQLMTNYMKTLGIFLSQKCSLEKNEIIKTQKELEEIKDIIDSSVYSVEESLDITLGLELYEEASKRINNLNNGNFKNCCK